MALGTAHAVGGRTLLCHGIAPVQGAGWNWMNGGNVLHYAQWGHWQGHGAGSASVPSPELSLPLTWYFALEVPVLILLPRGIIKWSLLMCQAFVKAFIPFN